MKNQGKAWACYAVYYGDQFLGFVHAWTESQAWGFVKRWSLANNYRQQYFNQELYLRPNIGCKNNHQPSKLLGAAVGSKGSPGAKKGFHHASEEAMRRQAAALRAAGERND